MPENFEISEEELKANLQRATYPPTNEVEEVRIGNLFKVPRNEQYQYSKFSEKFERYRLKVDIFKWLIGTVGLTLISYFINWGFTDRERGLIELQMYDRYANENVVFHKNPKNRLLLAQFYANVSPSDKLKDGWKDYLEVVRIDYEAFIKTDSIVKAQKEELSKKGPLTLEEKEKKESLELQNSEIELIKAEPLTRRLKSSNYRYYIIVSGDSNLEEAKFEKNKFQNFNSKIIYRNNSFRTIIEFANYQNAVEYLMSIKPKIADAYLVNAITWCPNLVLKEGYYECE